jgi:poly(hydroxyalkanoate) depolymerase family esterase
MKFTTTPALNDAWKLTRSGRLADATALIKRTLTATLADNAVPSTNSFSEDFLHWPQSLGSIRSDTPGQALSSPREGQFTLHRYSDAGGEIDYRLYVPSTAISGMPLVVMLHGCTQSAEDFARGTGMNELAEQQGFLVAYPVQSKAANAQRCWNWFRPSDQQRNRGEPSRIAGLTRQIIDQHQCDEGRIFVAGLSAGGAAAAIMGQTYPDLFAAVGIHSGLACGAARDLPSALVAMSQGGKENGDPSSRSNRVPVITFHGDRDFTVNHINSRHIGSAAVSGAQTLKTVTESGQVPGGHKYTREISTDRDGKCMLEQWTIHGAGHAWSGGSSSGSYTDALGPDASREMLRFFLHQSTAV